ncbi:SDR family NAD(P)-dependent oxidoreductase [Pseudomonas panipatensis]|uniref:NAD(P)-dependent dehydrogenase, short-chain alcohol dehydrogenase family n=1 Tax=Pseudomonas panipatensis TaxID=428992 RepID=A0A1G8DM95_9PSED|nr:SDR family oxidoreductase [Pseudomonas panipatensis]SDH58711.1 NAD(P)-dependent dehydrogenase, short-chain alcohol dehydrogenase family [Pseudomonas panipatensis]SMP40893.1 NAD(P)-dependent dehydrogenase, short-chain alcohol dehydrogenase family [Pseudomonas panipatensis]
MNKGVNIFSLEGKTALITGATGHLGASMAWILAEAGAMVLINSRSLERSEKVVASLRAAGLSAESAPFDITSPEAVERFVINMQRRPLHILINNAYVGGAGNIELVDTKAYTASYDVTMVATHRLLQSLLPNLRQAVKDCAGASVINLASMYALVSPDQRIYELASGANPPFYGAAKAALLHWTRYAGCEFGKEGIRVNAISPGPFPSETVQRTSPTFISTLAQKVPMGRIGTPDEIKGPTLFLASEASSFVNGANIVVDGGWTCW